ncbi:Calx-beta domain-containing protein [Solimonas variicoloris]|uniref:Calx-beta domain-containing protein n=1 Tax=Solimonas variicoloris TaxID=254408 RepID=UPI000685C8CA|nr:Calx-beta domain-containing protein [Solimonas variicoloris]
MKTSLKLRALGALFAALVGAVAAPAASAAGYYAQQGKIYDASGQQVPIRGISHYGFNANILQPQYLWSMGWKEQIAQIKALGFNAVRLPYVPDTLYVTTPVDQLSYVDPGKNADLIGKTPLQAMDMWMAEADRQGLYVMLDFHSVSNDRQYPTWFVDNSADFGLIYNSSAYTVDNWIRDLKFVAARYANLPHFFAIDIYNEPNGIVRWSTGDANMTQSKNYWKDAAEKAAAGVLAANPNLMIFVQGINGNWDGVEKSNIPMNYGEDFQPQRYQPLNIPADKLVLSPHTYGPDVYVKSTFNAANFPANLAADWETLFGQFYPTHPVVPGEWGGRYGIGGDPRDVAWQNAFVDYMLGKGMRDSFYWCYTPNSGDTGGILDDNLQVRTDKMALLQKLWGTSGTSAASIALSSSAYTVSQSAGSVSLSVNRSGGTGAVSVSYATAGGSAVSGTDFTAKSGTLSWAAGDTAAKTITIPVSNATPFSGSKTFTVSLSGASSGAALATPNIATVTINGSAVTASAGTLALGASSYSVTQNAGTLTVTVARSGGSSGAVSVQYATANGTAVAGTDYTAASGTLSWASGDTASKSFSVAISNATPFTGSKSFSITLSGTSGGATLGAASASVTINGSGSSSSGSTTSYTQPYIAGFTPSSGPAGTTVTISGKGFTGLSSVTIAGTAATFKVGSDTSLTLTVPSNASSGQIALINPKYAAWSGSPFSVTSSSSTTTAPGTLALGASSYSVAQSTGIATLSVGRASGSSGAVSVQYATVNGSAVAGTDYTATSGTLQWTSGDTAAKTISIPLSTQKAFTGSKSFSLKLSTTSGGAALGSPSSATVTINGGSTAYAQPYIQTFSPQSGAVGTVVTITGSGFTGLSRVTLGSSSATFQVVSDTQLKVTIPSGASTAQIALFNSKYAAWTPSAFTVTK